MKCLIPPVSLACLLLFPSLLSDTSGLADSPRTLGVDLVLERAIASRLIAGGVVVVGNRDGILHSAARGSGDIRLNESTVFDIASLTKIAATAPAVMKLVDEGRLSLSDPLRRWFPEFRRSAVGDVTLLDLLTHTSGLVDFELRAGQGIRTVLRRAAAQKGISRPGGTFNYADINFVLLGELVHRVSGRTLDRYCREEIFRPLGLSSTTFLPSADLAARVAPTLGYRSGVVSDSNARRLGGVAGHAGLFSSAENLSRFARMILCGGTIDGCSVLSGGAVKEMTAPRRYCGGTIVRGLGWDIRSPFSAPKGIFFSDSSFGHTGYSGSSMWIDPEQDLFVVVLTNRLNYRDTAKFKRFRSDLSTIAAAEFGKGEAQGGIPREIAKETLDLLRHGDQVKLSVAMPNGVRRDSEN